MSNKQKQLDADIRFAHSKIQMLGAMFPVDAPERHPVIHLHLMEMADTLVNLASAPMQAAHYNSLIARCKAAIELLEYLNAGESDAVVEAAPMAPIEQKEVFSSVRDALKESRSVTSEDPAEKKAAEEKAKKEVDVQNIIDNITGRYLDVHPGATFNPVELKAHIDSAVRHYYETGSTDGLL